jgi:protein-disulfide isomerase
MTRPARVHTALALLLLATACRRSAAPPPADGPGPASGSEIVARVDGVAIRGQELDERIGKRLLRLRQEEYEIRRQALEEMIGERLLEKEARSRGISRGDLLRDELEHQVQEPDPKVMEQLYEQNKARFGGRTKAEVLGEIRRALRDRQRTERQAAFQATLRQKAQVEVALRAPRTELAVPASAPTLGPDGAPVTIVEFTDYQCPFCHRAQATIDQVMSTYAGKVQLVHRDFPLEGHPQAFPAARASRCAGEQGKFWDYHRGLMGSPGPMDEADLKSRAARLSLDSAAFATCLASDRFDAAIRESTEAGLQAGVDSTPAYFINGRLVIGARPFEAFKDVIDAELGKSG